MEEVKEPKNLFWASMGWLLLGLLIEIIIQAIFKIELEGVVTYSFVLYKIYKKYKEDKRAFKFLKPKAPFKDKIEDIATHHGLDLFLSMISMFVLYFILNVLSIDEITSLFTKVEEIFSTVEYPSIFQFVLAILGVGIIGPIAEEIIFRGFLYDKHKKYSRTKAMLLNGLIFGLVHGGFLPPHYFGGLILFNIRDKQDDIYGAMGLHILNNIMVLFEFYLPISMDVLSYALIGVYIISLFKQGPLLFKKNKEVYAT